MKPFINLLACRSSRCMHASLGFTSLLCLFFFGTLQNGRCQVAMPSFSIIGQNGGYIGAMWASNSTGRIFPIQIAVDFNEQGNVYGFACEYRLSSEVFEEIRGKLEETIKSKRKLPKPNYYFWRDDDRRLAITLFVDKESNSIKLVAISTDATIRGHSRPKDDATKGK